MRTQHRDISSKTSKVLACQMDGGLGSHKVKRPASNPAPTLLVSKICLALPVLIQVPHN